MQDIYLVKFKSSTSFFLAISRNAQNSQRLHDQGICIHILKLLELTKHTFSIDALKQNKRTKHNM